MGALRRALAVGLLSLLLAQGSAGEASAVPDPHHALRGIKGTDDRIQVDARAYPWSAIGRLTKGDGSLCTAVMVGPATAVTAAHCLWNERTRDWMPPGAVFLTFGWEYGEWTAASQIERVDVAPAHRGVEARALADMAGDWAVLHLSAAVGRTTGWLGVAPLDALTYPAVAAGRPVLLQAGYSMDRRHVLTGHVGCHMIGWVADGVIAHDCDATRGDSGSPLFAWIDGEFRLLATHVSSFRSGDGTYGAAVVGGVIGQAVGTASGFMGQGLPDDRLMAVLRRFTRAAGAP